MSFLDEIHETAMGEGNRTRTLQGASLRKRVDAFCEDYERLRERASQDEKLDAILTLVQQIESTCGPWPDGNCRTLWLLLNKELVRNGFLPIWLDDSTYSFKNKSLSSIKEEVLLAQVDSNAHYRELRAQHCSKEALTDGTGTQELPLDKSHEGLSNVKSILIVDEILDYLEKRSKNPTDIGFFFTPYNQKKRSIEQALKGVFEPDEAINLYNLSVAQKKKLATKVILQLENHKQGKEPAAIARAIDQVRFRLGRHFNDTNYSDTFEHIDEVIGKIKLQADDVAIRLSKNKDDFTGLCLFYEAYHDPANAEKKDELFKSIGMRLRDLGVQNNHEEIFGPRSADEQDLFAKDLLLCRIKLHLGALPARINGW